METSRGSRADLHCRSTASQVSRLGVQRALGLPECATPPEEVHELVPAPPLRVVDVALFHGPRTGGIRTYLEAKARWAAAAPAGAIEHHVVVPGRRERHEGGRHELRALPLPAADGYRLLVGVHALERTVAELQPDVVLLHDPFWRPHRVVATAHAAGARVVAVHHGSGAPGAAGMPGPARLWLPLARAWMRRAYARVDAVMAAVDPRPDCGRRADLRLRRGVDPAFRPRPGVPRGDETVYAGRLAREKGILTLLQAAARSGEDWPLWIVGSGPQLRAIRSRAHRLGLGERLRLEPFVADPGALARIYARARCVVVPGEHERFGLVALEAACSGARVVTCATAPAARAIGDRVCDTFLPGDAEGLADAIAAARSAPRDRRAAADLAARHGWSGVFTAELERLRELAR
ncbi:MAG TPA: glycosyltransferase [Solirubrobacteraceae bacterium]|nr:glycosyltransferase [Solirubrobacteraceae bacterium]